MKKQWFHVQTPIINSNIMNSSISGKFDESAFSKPLSSLFAIPNFFTYTP